jgi:hypothetical protein
VVRAGSTRRLSRRRLEHCRCGKIATSTFMSLGTQAALLFLLAMPIASISWTVTHEELFREPREWCARRSRAHRNIFIRKFFYLFTCEYCFSHWVTLGALVLTRFHLWLPDWRGYLLAEFALVWIANVYMSAFGELRLEIRRDRQEIAAADQETGEAGTHGRPVEIQRHHRA